MMLSVDFPRCSRRTAGALALALLVLAPVASGKPARAGEPSLPNLVGHWDKLKIKKNGRKKTLQATLRVTNSGEAAAGESRVRFFLSTDRTLSEDDAPLTVRFNGSELPVEVPCDPLAAGASRTFKFDGIKLSKRDYVSKLKGKFLLGVVDFTEVVAESDEDDNVFPGADDKANPL
jgi:hypothetical protein